MDKEPCAGLRWRVGRGPGHGPRLQAGDSVPPTAPRPVRVRGPFSGRLTPDDCSRTNTFFLQNPAHYDFDWVLVDQVQVPAELQPGNYILSFRWDCEQTPQVWSACADIEIF